MMSEVSSVAGLVYLIKNSIEDTFTITSVKGEISNFTLSQSSHLYFTLSDSEAALSCVLFKGDALRNPIVKKLKDGDSVIITGSVSVYVKKGNFQLIVKKIYKEGEGDLKAQYEKLKLHFQQLGYFDLERKKEIPSFPKKIAIMTALSGAALQDFLNIFKRRSHSYEIIIVPTLVQGDKAALSIAENFKNLEQLSDIEVLVLARGGGAQEDLNAFNDPLVVEAIYHSKIPVISAIGHQVDFTLSDYVSDLRVETPSAAAEILTSKAMALHDKIEHLKKALTIYGKETFYKFEKRLERVRPKKILDLLNMKQERYASKLETLSASLTALDPKNVLKRGYSYVTTEDGKFIKNKELMTTTQSNDFTIHFYDGEVKVVREKE